MAFHLKWASGYSPTAQLQHVGVDEYAYLCGNTVVLKHRSTGAQRVLRGTAFGIQCFTTSTKHGIIAIADKGNVSTVHVYSVNDLAELAVLQPNLKLGVAAMAFSGDGTRLAICGQDPDTHISVLDWQTGDTLVTAPLPAGTASPSQISFHPYDHDRILTTGGGITLIWRIQRLWDKLAFKPTRVTLMPGDTEPHTCHAWHTSGVYIGTAAGFVFCVLSMLLKGDGTGHETLDTRAGAATAAAANAAVTTGQAEAVPGTPASDEEEVEVQEASVVVTHGELALPCFDATGNGSAVVSIAVSRDLVVVGGAERVAWYVHGRCLMGTTLEPQPYYSYTLGAGVSTASLSLGGTYFTSLLVGCTDGRLMMLDGPSPPRPSAPLVNSGQHIDLVYEGDSDLGTAGEARPASSEAKLDIPTFPTPSPPSVYLLVDTHVGPVHGMVPHPSADAVITCGADGTLRVWDVMTGRLMTRRTFASALTALAVAPNSLPMVAVGSELGVLRLVAVPPLESFRDGEQPNLQVTYRRRLHTAAIISIVFSPDGSMMATAGKDNCIWFLSINQRDGTMLPLGQISCPEPMLSLAWPEVQDIEDCIMVSLASGGVLAASAPIELHAACRPTTAADMQLTSKEVTIKVVKLEAPLLAMVAIPGEKYGEILGLGADTAVHRVVLPTEGQAWAGLKGRVHKSATKALVHGRSQGALALTPSRQLIVTGSHDGTVATHTLSLMTLGTLAGAQRPDAAAPNTLAAFQGGLKAGIHDITVAGATTVSFDHSGRYIVSAGTDGSVFVYETQGGAHLSRAIPLPPGAVSTSAFLLNYLASGSATDADELDDPLELNEAAAAKGRVNTTIVAAKRPATTHQSNEVVGRLQQLRTALEACMEANATAPELEKVDQADFLIDRQLQAQLAAEADQHVAKVREEAKIEDAALEIVAARVMHTCWTNMAVRGERVAGIKNPELEVPIMPLSKDDGHEKALSKVIFLRRAEMIEQRQLALAAAHAAMSAAHARSTDGDGLQLPGDSAHGSAPPPAIPHNLNRQSMAGFAEGDSPDDLLDEWAAAGNNIDIARHLYQDMDLYTVPRKAAQSHMLRQQMYDLKKAYNEEWDKLSKLKKTDADKIADLNSRMEEIVKELGRLGANAPPSEELKFIVPFPEDMQLVLTVRDDEVEVVDEIEPEEEGGEVRVGKGGDGRGGAMAAGEAGASERALRQMMGGTLAAREQDTNEFVLVRPEWMDGNPKLFSEEQAKEYKEFVAKEKAMAEEKAKRIAVLELELRTVRTAADDTAEHFDAQLQGLALRRAKAISDIAALECRSIELAAAVDAAVASNENAVRDVLLKMTVTKDQRSKIMNELTDKKSVLSQLEAQLADIQLEDKQLDKNFKKEFADADHHYAKLLHLYRYRVADEKDLKLQPSSKHGQSPQQQPPAQHHSQRPNSGQQPSEGGHSLHSHQLPQREARAGTASTLNRQQQGSAGVSGVHVGRPPSALDTALTHPLVLEAQLATYDPWPELPSAVAAMIPSSSQEPGALPFDVEQEPEEMDDSWAPDGCPEDLWMKFKAYRAVKVHGEKEIRKLLGSTATLRLEVPQLESAAAALQTSADDAMAEVQRMRAARKTALQDCVLQLKLKAGQVEVCPGPYELSAVDSAQALLVHRQRVQALNTGVQGKGERKVEVLRQIKDFNRGMHQVKWEAARCDLRIQELRDTVRDLQLLHVTRDMQAAYQKGGQEARAADKLQVANEQASLENLARQRDKLHRKAVSERARALRSMGQTINEQATQNTDVARHLVQLQKILEEQQRLRASMADNNEVAGKKMRSLVTHKKLKEIAMAQAQEVRALAAELDRLRLKTYPTFVEPSASLFPADTRLPPALTNHHHNSPPQSRLLPLNKSHPHLNFGQAGALRQ